jgi:cytochrome c peroxidase
MVSRRAAGVAFAAAVVLSSAAGCGTRASTGPGPGDDCANAADAAVAPQLSFSTGDGGTAALNDYREPCGAAVPHLLVVRASAAWCGTCAWHAAHTGELLTSDVGPRIALLDLLITDEDAAPADGTSLAAWRARIDTAQKVALDPTFSIGALRAGNGPLPLYVLVDTKQMTVAATLDDPEPDRLLYEVRVAIARMDRTPAPAQHTTALEDDRFGREAWDMIHAITAPAAPPTDPSNARADDPGAAALGKKLFSDGTLSPSGKVSCASCHDATKQLSDGLPVSTGGVSPVTRNAPAIALAPLGRWQFWDGRADSMWMQALGPPEAAAEIGSSRLFVDHAVWSTYKAEYEAVWGAMPDLSDTTRFPANGTPGSPEWAGMTADDQTAASRVYVNVGKSIAAYERTFRIQPNALDRYVAGDTVPRSARSRRRRCAARRTRRRTGTAARRRRSRTCSRSTASCKPRAPTWWARSSRGP